MQSVPGDLEQVMRHTDAARREDPKHSLRSRGRPWRALFKGCNAGPGHLGRSLRARREAAIRFVAPFDKDRAKAGPTSAASAVGLACKARRATDRFTSRCIHQTLVVRPPARVNFVAR
jgi:hypothetical protein